MAKGLPKSYIKKYGISKKAWKEYRKSKKRTTSRTRNPRRKGVKMPRKRRYHRSGRRYGYARRRNPRTIPILPLAGLAAGVAEPVKRIIGGDVEGGLIELVQRTTGVSTLDGTFHPEWLKSFWIPVIVSMVGHKVANMTGLNRMFSKLPSPLNKLRL